MTEDKPVSARELWATNCSSVYVMDPTKVLNPPMVEYFRGVIPKEAVSYNKRVEDSYQSKPLVDLTTLAIFNALIL